MELKELYSFLSDARLVGLVECVKVSDNFLDVISLSETQHSDMLAWCLHPNEGHGQGDAVVKDLLVAAYNAGVPANKFSNKTFFNKWTPGRVRTASFGSAFIAREFSLTIDGANRRGRLDLFLIDPNNRIVVTIENKAGDTLTQEQLSAYYTAVNTQIASLKVFKDYDFAYLVVDRDLSQYTEEHIRSLGNKWSLLDYSWLEASANRARHHMERNNQAAQLLMAYCQKQTGWQSPNEKLVSELAAELASQHEAVVDAIKENRRLRPTEWKPQHFSGQESELLLFIQQNRQLCDLLVQARGIGSVLVDLRKQLPKLADENIEHGRIWLRFATAEMQSLMQSSDGYWPIYLNIYRETASDDETSKFTLRLIWVKDEFKGDEDDAEALREFMANSFPGLEKFGDRVIRRLVLGSKLSAREVVKKAVEIVAKVEGQISAARYSRIL